MRYLLGLGSNLGDRVANLAGAISSLVGLSGEVLVSSLYETSPVGGPEGQGPYLNCVVSLEIARTPEQVLGLANDLEQRAGRVRSVANGPRTLDVDVLFADELRIETADLVVPHPRLEERAFVLAPLIEVAPELADAKRRAVIESAGGKVALDPEATERLAHLLGGAGSRFSSGGLASANKELVTKNEVRRPLEENDASTPRAAKEGDRSAVPYRVAAVTSTSDVISAYGALSAGESSGALVTVAGRVMRNRPQGGLSFAELRDWTGAVQLFALLEVTEDFESFVKLSLGDWVSATGEVMRTRRGELSVRVASFEVLARARRSFGDKWRGVSDPEIRLRQREVDLWANEDSRAVFLLRSRVVAAVRAHLWSLGFVEVETPTLQPLYGGGFARPFATHYNAMHADFYLRIAPELYLKRLVVGGFEKVFEIGKNFRNEGLSPKHNPEFTMLEAYLAYGDYLDMADLVESLVVDAAAAVLPSLVLSFNGHEIDLAAPWRRASLEEMVEEVTGLSCTLDMGRDELVRRAERLGVEVSPDGGAGKVLFEIYEKTTEGEIVAPTFVTDYPLEVSPLTRAHRSRPGYAERLTPVIGGREIGEIYSELCDPDEQRRRFVDQMAAHAAGDEEAMVLDEDFLRALEHGMPPVAGLGIGIDRLVMVLADRSNIKDVILFPALRPLDADEVAPGRDPGP